ncbi:hypothetical protein [Intestinimonas massiliensis (ex Afouda et al. 2020)]|jgi:hypothetical protein|uniref:Uncharacterized protein n=1 Tax=Intestinimonas massiliensis (ex Afouda et al. 2020) TaxID=1673721 RepID=A0AAW5JL15_9FIRM|nr:hypothetical protein [Intestinimonas massiliensis (ex Afouda et al. 2020)]MBS6281975.1 hypothetical protein [Oscillospiraceae bacterium]MCQ4769917.1 hypothetical protein [Intestinimonas massiliensis (ex Afouda et al. 2020)]MDU1324631.1 hypothetical protein [Clostridiales bacterium]
MAEYCHEEAVFDEKGEDHDGPHRAGFYAGYLRRILQDPLKALKPKL